MIAISVIFIIILPIQIGAAARLKIGIGDTALRRKLFCRGTSDRVWRSAIELRASLTNSDGGGIRTRDLPINSRSNPCLRHRQIFILVAALQTATQRSRNPRPSRTCDRRLGASRAGLAASLELLPGNKAIQAQGALPLSYTHRFAAMNGGIRTRDLPLNRRSIPNLRHR
jgi:hypothetical protein